MSCDHFEGSGRVYVDGGSGQGNGGGGSGGRVLIQCSTLTFEDENIGAAGKKKHPKIFCFQEILNRQIDLDFSHMNSLNLEMELKLFSY